MKRKPLSPSLGSLGSKLFAYTQMKGLDVIHLGDLQEPLGLTATQEHALLKRLAENGFALRLKRGIYLIPTKIPAGGGWQPNAYYITAKYMQTLEAKYYIGGMTAFHHYGFIQQVPNDIYVYNNKISGKRYIGKQRIVFIKKPENYLEGYSDITLPQGITVHFASLARTLMDAINDWSRYNSLPDAYNWVAKYVNDSKMIEELINETSNFANKQTVRRIGYFLESAGIRSDALNKLNRKLKATSAWVLLNPRGGYKGKTNNKWRVINNVDEHS